MFGHFYLKLFFAAEKVKMSNKSLKISAKGCQKCFSAKTRFLLENIQISLKFKFIIKKCLFSLFINWSQDFMAKPKYFFVHLFVGLISPILYI
jgi:hypothetical protein